MDLGFRFLTNR